MGEPSLVIRTARLCLRPFLAADAESLYALDNDPQVMRWINGGEPTPREAIERESLPLFMRRDSARPGFGFWAAEEWASGAFVGWFCLRASDSVAGQATLGYRLVRAFWGLGYATEGARALLELGFGELGLARVVATTYEENLRSRRVLEKLGFRLERRFRLTPEEVAAADTFHSSSVDVWQGDDLEYALERAAWERL